MNESLQERLQQIRSLNHRDITFNDYQEICRSTAIYPNAGGGEILYPVLGLCGEAGELANKVKKLVRDKAYSGNVLMFPTERAEMLKELGDVLYYVATIASELDSAFGRIALDNEVKILDRKIRGVIGGSGDNR